MEHLHPSSEDYELNANGELEMSFSLAKNEAWFSLEVIYMGEEHYLRRFYKECSERDTKIAPLKAKLLTEKYFDSIIII